MSKRVTKTLASESCDCDSNPPKRMAWSLDEVIRAVFLVGLGHSLGSLSWDDWDRLIHIVLLPLGTYSVILYLTVRLYHDGIQPRLGIVADMVEEEPTSGDAEGVEYDESAEQPVDMTGVYKLIENHNFEELLAAQGIPWALRGAANQARPTHRITHKGNKITIKIEGIIESQTTYQIGGPPVKGVVRGRRFEDQVTYLKDYKGIQTTKRAVDDGYTILVERKLAEDRSRITMVSTLTFDDKSKNEIQCRQIFQNTANA